MLWATDTDDSDETAESREQISGLETGAASAAGHQAREHLRHERRAHGDGRSRDATERSLVAEDVLNDERTDGDARAERGRADDLPADQHAQDATLNRCALDVHRCDAT